MRPVRIVETSPRYLEIYGQCLSRGVGYVEARTGRSKIERETEAK
jgi:hypothetical protein